MTNNPAVPFFVPSCELHHSRKHEFVTKYGQYSPLRPNDTKLGNMYRERCAARHDLAPFAGPAQSPRKVCSTIIRPIDYLVGAEYSSPYHGKGNLPQTAHSRLLKLV